MHRYAYLALALSLAACGGGGGGNPAPIAPSTVAPTSTPTPTSSPTVKPTAVAYSIKIKFVGGGTSLGSQTQIIHGRRVKKTYSHVLDTSINQQLPIEVAVQASPGSPLTQEGGAYGLAEVDVAPAPSTSPTIETSDTGAPVAIQTIQNDPDEFNITAQSSVPVSGSFTADLTGSVTGSATTPVFEIPQTLVACGDMPVYETNNQVNPNDQISSLTFANGVGNPQSSTASDFYIDGPNCSTVGTVNTSESEATLHFPYGAVLLSSLNTPFSQLSASQFSNSFTSITYSQFVTDLTAINTPPNEFIIQTASGSVVKIAPFSAQDQGNENFVLIAFGYQQTGFSVDGF